MKVITCVGYHDTGSGAVDDFLRGFDNVAQAKYGVECRFLQDPDCVSDLEYNIVENPHRLNTGYALKRFLRFVKMNSHTYQLIFGDAWERESKKYIKDLIDFSYKGYWSGDMMLMPPLKRGSYYIRRGINKIVPSKYKKPSTWNYFPKERTLHCSLTETEFIEKTNKYVNALLCALNTDDKDWVVLDQAVPGNNISRYSRYFPCELKVIVVDRDPRDVFIEETILKGRVLPKNVREFCAVFRDSRQRKNNLDEGNNVLRINFEDLVYHYEETKERICGFVGLPVGLNNGSGFDPNVSVKNTQLWKKHPEFNAQVEVIKNLLDDYLYTNY